MSNRLDFFKNTVIGGLIFLVPIVVVIVVLGKAYKIMMVVAGPLDGLIPVDRVGGIALANLVAIVILVLCCYFAGLAARRDRTV